MKLSSVFLGAALMTGAMMGPGAYYRYQDHNEYVRARVTGKVEAEDEPIRSARPYIIYTNKGKFDTYESSNGADLQIGAFYEFNLRGAKFQMWPPSYTRSIKSARLIDGPKP